MERPTEGKQLNREALLALAREAYRAEMEDHLSYRALAARARDPGTRRLLERVAAMEGTHARFWERVLEGAGEAPPPFPGLPGRRRLVVGLARWINPALLVSLLELGETGAAEAYGRLWRSGALPPTEAEGLRRIILDELEHEASFRKESRRLGLEHVRDLVLGMNDGLVEILGAVTGLTAAYPGQPRLVALSGVVVGLAGALSMGIGAWISVRSQRQVDQGGRRRLELLFAVEPKRAREAYRERLEEAGIPAAVADEVTTRVGEDPEGLRRLLLGGEEAHKGTGRAELRAGLLTGVAYLAGALVPVLPYLLASNAWTALVLSVLGAGAALAAVGGVVAALSGLTVVGKVREMLLAGLGTAALAYLFGTLLGDSLGVTPP